MTCEQAEPRMAELLAGGIRPADREVLERHLLECAACRADFESAKAGWSVEWPDRPVPAEAVERVRESLRGEPALLPWLRFGTAAAAAFCVALLLVASNRRPDALRPEPRSEVLAYVQDAGIGALSAKDEEGRPVGELALQSHRVTVEIADGIAMTTVEENFRNETSRRLEGTFVFPLPPDASISRLALEVNGKIEEGTVVERERAREVFESIVRKMQDPALLEWMPGGLFKCRVFPIEPRSTKRVIVAYTQVLPCFRGRMTYAYPLVSEKTREHPPEELGIELTARFSGGLRKAESASHLVDVQRRGANKASASLGAKGVRPQADFVMTFETAEEELRLLPHRPEGDDGYFALVLAPGGAAERRPAKYVFVLDVSATVSAPELEVAKRLVRALMGRAIPGDRFEVMAHHIESWSSGEVDVRAANDFMDRLQPLGGCDVLAALRAAPDAEIFYIGEGTPTLGETDTAKILDAVRGRRIRTVAVGSDANLALLERLGGCFRINPNDNVTRRVAEIADTLGMPVIRGLQVEGADDVVGLRDVFAGERIVVAGRHKAATRLVVTGPGWRRELDLPLPAKEEANSWVRRFWAARRCADLAAAGKHEEVVALGVRHQIMTPYTSLLVLESEEMWKQYGLKREVQKQDKLIGRATIGAPAMEAFVRTRLRGLERLSPEDRAAELAALPRFIEAHRHPSVPADKYRKARELVAAAGQQKLYSEVPGAAAPSSEAVARRLQSIEASLEEIGADPLVRPEPAGRLDGEMGRLMEEGTRLYKEGRFAEAAAKLEEAFEHKPSSDQVYAYLKKVGDDVVAGMMNSPDRRMQDAGRRVLELARPGEPFRMAEAVVRKHLEDARSSDLLVRRNAEWHLKNMGVPVEPETETMTTRRLSLRNADSSSLAKTLQDLLDRNRPIQEPSGQVGPGFTTNESARLESYDLRSQVFHSLQKSGLTGAPFALDQEFPSVDLALATSPSLAAEGSSLGDVGGLHVLPLLGGLPPPDIFTITTNVTVPGAPITDPAPVTLEAGERLRIGRLEGRLETSRRELAGLDERLREARRAGNQELSGRLGRELADLEERHVELARTKKHIEEKINATLSLGSRTDIAPRKPLEGKISAVANEIGMYVLSQGKDDGVVEGDEFTVLRGGDFVAKLVVDRADRRWSAAKVVLKKTDPRPGDDVSNHVFVSASSDGRVADATASGQVALAGSGWRKGELVAITRDSKFVAIVMILEVSDAGARGAVWRGMSVTRVLSGDRAERVADVRAYVAALPEATRLELGSTAGLAAVRARMGMRE